MTKAGLKSIFMELGSDRDLKSVEPMVFGQIGCAVVGV